MLSFALSLALAAPCGVPHPHKHKAPEPAQTCAAQPVPMCFRDPVPDPDVVPMPIVAPYYINVPPVDDGTQGEGPWIEAAWTSPVVAAVTLTYTAPPAHAYVPPPIHKTPELNVTGTAAGLTLLFGLIAIITNKRPS